MRDITTSALALGLLGRLAMAQSDAASPVPECSIMLATPFDAIAFPLKDGEGILGVVAGIIDSVTVAPPGNAKRHYYPVVSEKLLQARQDPSTQGGDNDDDGGMPPSVACTAHETCIATYAGNAFCYDTILGTFHDVLGTKGSVVTGDYELADGQKGNYRTGPHPSVVSPVMPANSTGSAAASGTTRATGPTSSHDGSPVDRTGHAGRNCAVIGTVLGAMGMVAAVGNIL